MTTGFNQPPKITVIVLPDGGVVPILAWGKLKQDVVDRLGEKVARTLWLPVLSLENMRGDALNAIYDNIMSTYEGESDPEVTSNADKILARLDPTQTRQMAILSSLESTAISQNMISPADIDTNEGLRTVIGDMVKQWGQGIEGVNPLDQLAAIKKYMPELPAGTDLNLPENTRLRQSRIAMARDIANVPEEKRQEVADTWNAKMTPQPAVPPTAPLVPRPQTPATPITSGQLEQAAREATPLSQGQPPGNFAPLTVSPNDMQAANVAAQAGEVGYMDTTGGAASGLFERKRAEIEKRRAVWQNLVEQARNQMQKAQKQVRF